MTQPLFHVKLEDLKSSLRLSGVNKTEDTQGVIERAVSDVRTGFFRELGISRVNELLALTEEDPITTEDGVIFDIAKSTELKWVRYELLATLPSAFLDSFGRSQARWNEEAPFQDSDQFERTQERKALFLEIRKNLDLLETGSLGSSSYVQVQSNGPDPEDVIRPGETAGLVWPYGDILSDSSLE